jgi:hypothetical protein
MTFTTIFIKFLLFLNIGHAQIDYSKFEYPDVERKALNASLIFNGKLSYFCEISDQN